MSRILMIRHGETNGESSIRFHGATDVTLSDSGRAQMRAAARQLPGDSFDRVVASPLARAWEGARIVWPRGPIVLEAGFREIDFGRWEGLTAEEIERLDPSLYRVWREKEPDFEFPEGERRSHFRARVEAGLERQLASGARSLLLVVHKGVVRTIVERLCGEALPDGEPGLGGVVQLSLRANGDWAVTSRWANPEAAGAGATVVDPAAAAQRGV